MIRVTANDLATWKRKYPNVDVMSELGAADDYYRENPPKDGKWFFPASNWLKRAEQHALQKRRDEKDDENRFYKGIEIG